MFSFMPSLVITNSNGKQHIPIEGTVSIGRHPKNTICIAESEISKQHAKIEYDGKQYIFRDLGSANGSYFNELRITEHICSDGDTLRLGHTLITFKDSSEVAQDVSTLVSFEQFDDAKTTEFQERVDVAEFERFQPEQEVADARSLRTDYEKLRLGQELLQHIGFERDLDKLLVTIAKQLIPMFSADRSVILLVNNAGEFETKAVHSIEKLDAPITVSSSVLREVKTSKTAVLLSKNEKEDEIAKVSSLKIMGISSVMCAPIIHGDEVIGAIHLDLRTGQGGFIKKDLQLLGGISIYIAMAVENARLADKVRQETQMQAQFERLLSPSIVKQLVSGKLHIGQAGELRQVTIMFVDIRDFTRMSQKSAPKAVVHLLNDYFERVVEIIFKYGGTVDKFMGDGVMVLFGAPIAMNQQADAAISCALEIQAMLGIWNKQRIKDKQSLIPVGIGINSGEVVVGAIGSSKTMQYTCIGNAVNVASRLTGVAKAGQIIASQSTMKSLQSKVKFKALPPQDIKGFDDKVQAYDVLSLVN
jgi:adenylate cyclase